MILRLHPSPTLLDIAVGYCRRGWSVIPIPFQSKNPGFEGWQHLRLLEDQLRDHFNGKPQNIGVLLGEPSGWLVDVDLDHPCAVELADQYLPATPLVFGRPGKPRSHRLYRVTAPIATKKFKSRSAGMIVEIRSSGAQTVFPPSTHEKGEPIRFDDDSAEPALISPEELFTGVSNLAAAVLQELGEQPVEHPQSSAPIVQAADPCLAAMLRMALADHNDGSGRLFAACCRVVEHDRDDAEGIALIREYACQKPFPKGWTDEEILKRIRDAEGHCQRGSAIDLRPTVVIDTEEHRVVSESIAALGQDSDLFHRGGMLVRVLNDHQANDGIHRAAKSAMIGAVPVANLRERMTRCARLVRFKKGEECPAHPTGWLVNAVDARGDWPGIRRLKGISDVPVLHADGSIFQTPGYDEVTGVLYEPSAEFHPIPTELMLDDAQLAAQELLEVVGDFRFEAPEHRSAWLAGLLTPLARFAFHGPAPFFLIDANVRGAGKGLLARVIGWIALGHEMPVSSYSHEVEEMRKKITAIAVAGDRLVLLDNLEGRFGNDALDRALTATAWRDRLLGKTQQVELPLLSVWYGTGNNVAVGADTARRIIHIRLDVLEEYPEKRQDFRHADLIGWVREHRARLVELSLTILAAYCRAGRPKQDLPPYGSFEDWSRLVREAIVWARLPDPCLTRDRLAETSDTTADTLEQLLLAWRDYDPANEGLIVADVVGQLYPAQRELTPLDEASAAMRAALENLVGCASGKVPSVRHVGIRLRSFRRRVVGGQLIDQDGQRRSGAVWKIKTREAASMRV